MSSRQPPAWKRGAGSSDRGNGKRPDWRPGRDEAKPPRRGLSRRGKLFLYGGGLAVLCTLILVIIFLLRPYRPSVWVFYGADYAANPAIPPNAYGWLGLRRLGNSMDDNSLGTQVRSYSSARPYTLVAPQPMTETEGWDKPLRAAIREDTVVVFFDLHGGADATGPYLLADAAGGQQKLYLSQVLARLQSAEGLQGKNKLLLIDATKVAAHWPHFVHNDFVRAVESQLGAEIEKDPRLSVVLSSDIGQPSCVSEEWGCSVFTQKIMEALGGKADRNGDRIVRGDELFDYLQAEVKAWAKNHRACLQVPIVLPRSAEGDDKEARKRLHQMKLTGLPGGEAPPAPPAPAEAEPAEGAAPAPPTTFPPDWLVKAWRKREEIAALRPEAYAPHVWRLYLARLLRCEELARAGHPDAESLSRDLDELARSIQEAQRPPVPLASFSLAAARAAGEPAELSAAQEEQCKLLWEGNEKADPASLAAVSSAVQAWLLKQVVAEKDLKTARERAVGFLGKLPTRGERPAEVLLLALVTKPILDGERPPELDALLRKALQVRRLAEEAAWGLSEANDRPSKGSLAPPYAERIVPWLQPTIEQADTKRRMAEDALFSSNPDDWKEADALLTQAEAAYQEARKEAAAVRAALGACDELYTALPFYSQWLARSDLSRDKEKHQGEYNTLLQLWDELHALDAEVRSAPRKEEDRKKVLATLGRRAQELRDGAQRVADALDKDAAELASSPPQPDNWRRIDDLLAVPFLPADRRVELLAHEREISAELQKRVQKGAVGGGEIKPEEQQERTREAAERQARLALRSLGQRRFDEVKADPSDQARPKDWVPRADIVAGWLEETPWQDRFRRAALLAGHLWADLPRAVTDRITAARSAKPDEAAAELVRADRLSRQALAAFPLEDNPSRRLRDLQLRELLLWQARRTLLDCSWGEQPEPTATPYYRTVGLRYLDAARKLIEEKDEGPTAQAGRKVATELQAALSEPVMVNFGLRYDGAPLTGGDEGVLVSGEPTIRLGYDVEPKLPRLPDGAAIPGRPAVWIEEVREGGQAGALTAGARNQEALGAVGRRRLLAGEGERRLALDLENPHPLRLVTNHNAPLARAARPLSGAVQAVTFFRGLRVERKTPLEVRPVANSVVYRHPVPPGVGGVTIMADRDVAGDFEKPGSLVIVLDQSVSMEARDFAGGTRSRLDAARDAFRQILQSRGAGRIPEGTIVSVITFGHHYPGDMADNDRFYRAHRQWGPKPWTGPRDAEELLKKVNALKPADFGSPVAKAMVFAEEAFADIRRDFPAEYARRRTLLVFTDGEDNRFSLDTKFQAEHRVNTIPELMVKTFQGKNIGINFVLFQSSEEEEAKALAQFGVIEEKLRPRGRIYREKVEDIPALVRLLREALGLRMSFRILKEGQYRRPRNPVPPGEQDLSVQALPERTWYYYPAGSYELHLGTRRGESTTLDIQPGDLLMLRDTSRGLRPALLGDVYKGFHEPKEQRGWRVSVLQNEYQEARGQQKLLIAAERLPGTGRPDVYRVERPRDVWFSLRSGKGDVPPAGVAWGNLPGLPASAWQITLPSGAPDLALDAWVRTNRAPGEPLLGGQSPPEKGSARGKVGRVAFDARVETLRAYDALGAAVDGVPMPCLVVRATYDTDQPFYLRADGLTEDRGGYEHHYFTRGKAGRYTGVFWFGADRSEKELLAALASMELVPLAEFKNEQAIHFPFESRDMPRPQSQTQLPPDLDLFKQLREFSGR